jgi:tetratricopeptide (TPR) repeat protein
MTVADTGPRRSLPPIGAIIVLIPAAYCYLAMAANLSDLGYSDAAGNALTAAFAALFGFAAWVLLGVLLVIAGVKGNIPAWAGTLVAILLPASAITSAMAADLSRSQNSWVLIEPYALPPLIAAYALYARLTSLHRAVPLVPATITALVAMTILTLVPMPQFIARERERAVIEAEREAERKAADEAAAKVHAENLAKFEALTPASPLSDWAPFFGKNSELDERAIAAARKLPHRQEQAIDALHRGLGFPLAEYSRLDLQPTPEFCAASRDFLIAAAASHPGSPDNRAAQDYFDPMLGAVELLTKENCDLDAAVKAIDAATAISFEAASFRASLAWRQANGFSRREDYDRAIAGYSTAIGLSPDFAQYWADRGDAYLDKLEYAKAIPDYTEAIRINQGYSTAYNSRGFAEHSLGDDDRALADFDKAIEWRHDFPRALYNRGDIYLARGDLTRAIADYDAAINLSPKMWEALAARGRTHYAQGAYAEAAIDLSAALPLGSSDTKPYTVLWLYLARIRAGQPTSEALAQDAAKLDKTAWPWPIVSAFLGETTPDAVLGAAHGNNAKECEADFYFGAKAVSRDLLQNAVTICPHDFIEASAAKLELAKPLP